MDLDLEVLKLIMAHVMSISNPCKIYLLPGIDVVVMIRSSIKALIGGSQTPDLDRGPLHFTSAAFTTMFIAIAKRMMEIVITVIFHFQDVSSSLILLGTWWRCRVSSTTLRGVAP